MNKEIRVAVFPAGSQIGLEVNRALKNNKHIRVIGFGSVHDAAHAEFDEIYDAPWCTDKDIGAWAAYQDDWFKIDHWILTNELALEALSKFSHHRDHAIEVCGDKLLTYEYFSKLIRCPKVYTKSDFQLPVFIKPRKGHSAKGCRIERSMNIVTKENELMLEYLPGKEYTIDCFSRNGSLLYHQSRERETTLGGVSIITQIANDHHEEIEEMAKIISKSLTLSGAWFFQVKEKDDHVYLMEIGLRIAGSSGLQRAIGINLSLLEVYDQNDVRVSIPKKHNIIAKLYRSLNTKLDKSILKTYKYLYIDLDDTLICEGKVNHQALAFMYVKDWTRKILISRSSIESIKEKLDYVGFSTKMFEQIISTGDTSKADLVSNNSVFVDDSFRERKEVSENNKRVLCLDVNELDFYL